MELDGGKLSNKAPALKKQALPVKGPERLRRQPNSVVVPKGIVGMAVLFGLVFFCLN